MYSMGDWRKRNIKMMDPRQYSFDNYYTDASQKMEIKHSFGDELLNSLHLLQDPLKKNLADTIVTNEVHNKKTKQKPDKNFLNMIVEPESPKMESTDNKSDFPPMPSFAGITSFFSGVLNVITGAVSQWRPKSPAQYYDCFDDSNVSNQGSPPVWQPSKDEDQNKSVWADQSSDAELYLENMEKDCKVAIANCENKLNKVRLLLDTKPKTPTFRSRRPRKVFVEPGSIEESFEDAFSPEDFVSIANSTYVKYSAQCQYQRPELIQTASPKTHIKTAPVLETTEIVKTLPEVVLNNTDLESSNVIPDNAVSTKLEPVPLEKPIEIKEELLNTDGNIDKEVVSTCEDKLSKLKALLQERRKKNTKSLPSTDSASEPVEHNDRMKKPSKMVPIEQPKDKHFKNPCRTTDKRKKTKLRKSIQDDLLFSHEVISDDLSSAENSPSTLSLNRLSHHCPINKHSSPNDVQSADYFDEVSGRFNSSYTDSEDSFQIVFNDSPKPTRMRQPSDCDSEDSFIVFEDSPDSCYTSNDVFGDEDSDEETDTDCSDAESELSDSGCVSIAKMSQTLSRTIGDLTDDSLYDEQAFDEVDCAVRTGEDLEVSEKVCDEVKSTGLLIDAAKKLQRKNQPPKKVHFSSDPPKVHVMRVWAFAARQARAGHWERCAIDRERFKRRIADVDMAVSWVLKPQHRSRVMFQRFMPWWNAQKRKEIAEKKAREAEELVRKEEEKRLEEERIAMEEEQRKIEEERIRKEEEEKRIEEEKLKIENASKVHLNKTNGIKNGKEQKASKKTNKICNGNLLNGKINTINNINAKNKLEIKCKTVDMKNKLDENNTDVKNKQIIPVNDKIDVKFEVGQENISAT